MKTRTLGVIGTGQIGSSIGLNASRRGDRVLGFDTDPIAAERALRLGAIEKIVPLREIYERCNALVFAAHPRATITLLEQIDRNAPPRASFIIDVASVKAPIVRAALGLPAFVATHPMAGTERSGPDASRADLFAGKSWLYVPGVDPRATREAIAFIGSTGAVPVPIEAETHDRVVAWTSHLPQLFAWVFAEALDRDNAASDPYYGPVARELLRLGRSNPHMWREIFALNSENVASGARELAARLQQAARSFESAEAAP